MEKSQKFMDQQRKPRVEGSQNKNEMLEPSQTTGFTAAADRITPYDPDELEKEKDQI